MNAVAKLRILIPHWIAHNHEHAEEFRRWAAEAVDVGQEIRAAADALAESNQHLQRALERLAR
jgi:hypothetical protein